MSNYVITEGGELKHYGVIGMKWGVRKGRTQQAYAKASKKLEKLDKQYRRTEVRALKKSAKADKSTILTPSDRARRRAFKASKAQKRLDKKLYKARTFYEQMDETFKNTDIKMTARQRQLGKEYLETAKMRSQMKYMTVKL